MPEPEDEKFSEDMQTLDELFKRMAQRGLIVTYGNSDKTKRIAVEFTPDGQEVILTFYTLEKLIGPLNPKQVLLLWRYMVKYGETLFKKHGQ